MISIHWFIASIPWVDSIHWFDEINVEKKLKRNINHILTHLHKGSPHHNVDRYTFLALCRDFLDLCRELSKNVPKKLHDISRKLPEQIWEHVRNYQEYARKIPGHFWDISRTFLGNVQDISGKLLGHFRQNFMTFLGIFLDMPRKIPWQCLGKFWDIYRKFLCFAMFCYVLLCFPMFSYVFPMFFLCFAMFCYVFPMFCYVLLCFWYVLLCFSYVLLIKTFPGNCQDISGKLPGHFWGKSEKNIFRLQSGHHDKNIAKHSKK